MRVRNSVPMLAAAATVLASTSPAYAFDSQAPAGGSLPATPVAVQHQTGSSPSVLELAAIGVIVVGGGIAAARPRVRAARLTDKARITSGS